MNHKRILSLTLLTITVVVLGSLIYAWTGVATARGILVQDYLDSERTIQYIGNVDDTGFPIVVVMYDGSSVESLRHYANASQLQGEASLQAGVSDFYVVLTFRRALNENEFRAFIRDTGFAAHSYMIRATNSKGQRITMSGGPENGDVLPANELASAMAQIGARENNQAVGFSGVFEAQGTASAEVYRKLVADPRVFVADVTGTLVYHNPNYQKAVRFTWQDFVTKLEMSSGSGPFWYMEDLGLANFAADH